MIECAFGPQTYAAARLGLAPNKMSPASLARRVAAVLVEEAKPKYLVPTTPWLLVPSMVCPEQMFRADVCRVQESVLS